MSVYTYLPDQVKINFFGVPLTGFADGDFITVSPHAENWTKKVGADGIVTRTRSNDYTEGVELILEQASPSNTYLSGISAIDRATGLGAGPMTIVDLSGKTLHAWTEVWIIQKADTTLGKESGDRSWAFDTGQAIVGADTVGGNEA